MRTLGCAGVVAMSEEVVSLPVVERLQLALERIRPAMQLDGGDIHFVEWVAEEGLVRVALSGACHGCSMSTMTMTLGVERTLKALVPEVQAVEAV